MSLIKIHALKSRKVTLFAQWALFMFKMNSRFCVEILKLFTSLRTMLVLRLMQDFPKFDIFSETPASTSILKKSYLVYIFHVH